MLSFSPDAQMPRRLPLTLVVASLALRKILRHYMRGREISFIAVLVLPDIDLAPVYRDAAEFLVHGEVGLDMIQRSRDIVSVLLDYQDATSLVFVNKLRKARRAIVLVGTKEGMPPHLKLAADFIEHIEAPTQAHFLAAARHVGISGMTPDDAQFLCPQRFKAIDLAFRKGRSVHSAVRRLRTTAFDTQPDASPQPEEVADEKRSAVKTLMEVHGYGEAKEWGLELAADIAEWKNGSIPWSDVDSGALISGPPGCGKTTFASALAASCGMDLIVTSAARWQAKGHLGDYLRAMRDSFDQARKKTPCILFLDEFDSVGDRDAPGDDEHWDYKRQAVNGLLECIDGADGKEGVVVVGATNNPGAIDPALLRPGRLETHLRIPMPDEEARVAIFKQHLGTAYVPGSLSLFVSLSRGWTGAMIEKLAKDAKRLARRSGQPLDILTISQAMPKFRSMSGGELEVTSTHEAGHALVGCLLTPFVLEEVYIERQVMEASAYKVLGEAVFTEVGGVPKTAQFYNNKLAMLLAGLAAEQVVFGAYSDGGGGKRGSDLSLASDLATTVERQLGLGGRLSADFGQGRYPLEALRLADADLRRRVETTLRREFDRVVELLTEYRDKLELIADALRERGHLSGDEVRDMIAAG